MCLAFNRQSLLQTLIISTFLLTNLSWALPSDKQQAIQISADSVSLNRKTGLNTYQGHVLMQQGSSILSADIVIARLSVTNQLQSVIAQGQPATYTTQIEEKKPLLHLEGQTIEYYPETGKIILIGNAKANQGKDSFAGPIIEYDSNLQILKTSPSKQGRTTIILEPQGKI